jgi:hypothetical protein
MARRAKILEYCFIKKEKSEVSKSLQATHRKVTKSIASAEVIVMLSIATAELKSRQTDSVSNNLYLSMPLNAHLEQGGQLGLEVGLPSWYTR